MRRDEEKQLRDALGWQYRPKHSDLRLGEEIQKYIHLHQKSLEKNALLMEVWENLIPPLLQEHCRPDRRRGNTLYIQADPGAYMHQMQLIAGELLERINEQLPRSGIQKIKIIPI